MFRLAVIFRLFAVCYAGIVLPSGPRVILPIAGRIVGGVETTIEDIPHQVALLYLSSLQCGGSIIREDVIVSACHCVYGLPESGYTIRAGSSRHNSGGQVANVKQIIRHEQYNGLTVDFDISLILTAPLKLGSGVKPIALPKQDQDITDGSMSVTSGWGTTSQGGNIPAVLRKVSIPIVNQKICYRAYQSMGWAFTDQMICAGDFENGGKDACQGDSGGPLTVENELVGITSWGNGCARPGFPGVWARVPAFISWIEKKLA